MPPYADPGFPLPDRSCVERAMHDPEGCLDLAGHRRNPEFTRLPFHCAFCTFNRDSQAANHLHGAVREIGRRRTGADRSALRDVCR